jgi:uncharacterized protein YndB with AHSA1/START domain
MSGEPPGMKTPSFRPARRSHPSLRAPVAISIRARFGASPERVFDAWLDPDVAGRWLFATAMRPPAHVEIDARVAGSFRFIERRESGDVEHRGEYVEIVPYRRLVFTLVLADLRRIGTRVIVDVEPRATGSNLALLHENVPRALAEGIEARWIGMLYGLGVTLDANGGDPGVGRPRIARRGPLRRSALGEGRTP